MIDNIKKTIDGKSLIVEVFCKEREFVTHPIKLLTTEELFDILLEEYKNIKLVEEPNNPVGNSNRRKVNTYGKWVFNIQSATKKPTTKKPTTKKPTTKKPTTKRSIRGRISKIANEQRK